MSAVLDASALLAYVRDEPGAEAVDRALEEGAYVSAVNWAEVLSKLAERGQPPEDTLRALADAGILVESLIVHPLDEVQAVEIARLRPLTREAGLSLADRVCLALATTLGSLALTADGALSGLDVGPRIDLIR